MKAKKGYQCFWIRKSIFRLYVPPIQSALKIQHYWNKECLYQLRTITGGDCKGIPSASSFSSTYKPFRYTSVKAKHRLITERAKYWDSCMQEESIIVVKMISHQFLNIRYIEYVHITATPKKNRFKAYMEPKSTFRKTHSVNICESSSVFSSKYM